MFCWTNIQPIVGEYISQSQSAYHHGRSTLDIVWCNRFLAADVERFQEEIMISGIDMTLAFDTIKRTKLTEILESYLQVDEIRIIKILFSNITLDSKSSNNISNAFDTNFSPLQGDGLSGCLFIINYEKASRTLRDWVENNHVTGEHSYKVSSKSILPDECIYADDTDFIND